MESQDHLEERRLEALKSLQILDTLDESEYDEITQIASDILRNSNFTDQSD